MKKALSVILSVLLILSCVSAFAFAADGDISVSLRVEGIDSCMYERNVNVKAPATVEDVVKKAAETSSSLTVTLAASDFGGYYITSINDETEKTFGGLDGWMFRVNGVEGATGISSSAVQNGDDVVIYYSDAYGIGMQYPQINATNLDNGIISFTSLDTVYDENWNPTQVMKTVTNYTLTWYYGDNNSVKISCSDDGVVTIPDEYLEAGTHRYQIEKYADNGCPMVLRFGSDATVTIVDDSMEEFTNIFDTVVAFVQKFIDMFVNFFKNLFNVA